MIFLVFQRLDKEDRPTGCILCPKRGDIEIDYKVRKVLHFHILDCQIFIKIQIL